MCSNAAKWSGLVLAVIAFAGFSTAMAQRAATDIVRERQQEMKTMAAAAKNIDAMFKGASPYDAKAFKAAAETVRTYSGERLARLFAGTVAAEGSKASVNIEAERPAFDKLAAELGAYAAALSIAADRNPDVLAPGMRMPGGDAKMGGPLAKRKTAAPDPMSMPAEHAFHTMLQVCTSCHAKFRAKD
ncbi:cytochrome c [Ensifer adhaerens]|uniref:cytochrome c n=1 Tax=Ensifer adhaerens TaxID=106592 RepID=UPI001CBCFD07|nr:cytochrome c [Ensifer adhaerens]MBZ7926038.1 cytochrome c [Ensifer adhaerens]UAX94814.1 cytochrome c [Ensifer adhaerens]UAY03296.1 cytochrome c [Ensifer adhaerens]UAY11281.1 cytochrome c [Ensifer adhaerens]